LLVLISVSVRVVVVDVDVSRGRPRFTVGSSARSHPIKPPANPTSIPAASTSFALFMMNFLC
jgi:hypothetical protein